MRTTQFLTTVALILCQVTSLFAQTWNIPSTTGGGTSTSYLGTTNATDLILKTGATTEGIRILGTSGSVKFAQSHTIFGYNGSSYLNWSNTGNFYIRSLSDVTNTSSYTDRMVITNTGSVGFGVDPPISGLHLKNSNTNGTQIWLDATNQTGGNAWAIQSTAGTNVQGQGKLMIGRYGVAPQITLSHNSENVGIGYASQAPTALLDLKREEAFVTGMNKRNVMLKLSNVYQGTVSQNNYVNEDGTMGPMNEPTILFDNGTTNTTYGSFGWAVGASVAGSGNFRIASYTGSPTAFTTAVTINQVGKVGIGTTNFSGDYKLYVGGKVICEALKVKLQANWPDFVFAKNYTLKPLAEVETYIKENNHLPDVPSAAEVQQNGIETGEMFRVQMQKIEELTLYLLEMDKKLNQLESENKQLKNKIETIEQTQR